MRLFSFGLNSPLVSSTASDEFSGRDSELADRIVVKATLRAIRTTNRFCVGSNARPTLSTKRISKKLCEEFQYNLVVKTEECSNLTSPAIGNGPVVRTLHL